MHPATDIDTLTAGHPGSGALPYGMLMPITIPSVTGDLEAVPGALPTLCDDQVPRLARPRQRKKSIAQPDLHVMLRSYHQDIAGHDAVAHPARPRPASPAGEHRLFDRAPARRQPVNELQVCPGNNPWQPARR